MDERPSLEAAVIDLVPAGLFAIDADWRIVLWNRCLESWTGTCREAVLGADARSVFPELALKKYAVRIAPLFEGGPPVVFSHELNARLFVSRKDGRRERQYGCVAAAMPGGGAVLFTVEDKTESAALLAESRRELALRKATEARLIDAVNVKEMLAREASHRVKNNLTIILSLIGLESENVVDAGTRTRLEALEARIHSISLIHELLYKGEVGEEIRLDDYLRRLCENVFSTLLPTGSPARLELELAPSSLDIDKTLYVGLVVVELLTNALKYAIMPRGRGLVRVALRGASGLVELSVADDGPGFGAAWQPAGADKSPCGTSLGQSLLSLLASELGAEIESGPAILGPRGQGEGPGTRVALRISTSTYRELGG